MQNNDSVGRKIVEALKKQAENMDIQEEQTNEFSSTSDDIFASSAPSKIDDDFYAEPARPTKSTNFFDDIEEEKDPFFAEPKNNVTNPIAEPVTEQFEMPANITVLKKLISQLPSGVSRHTGAQIIKQTMEALGISMKSVLQDAQQVQENLKVSARECQASIQEYKKQILTLEKQSQSYQKQYSALNDLISLFIQTTK